MSYNYYQNNVKPKPRVDEKKGYVYEEDNLPEDFVCPLCKHSINDFEEIK